MDAWDPQTLGLLVFGGFMVVSAVGMALVSLVSMRETSYEDALQRQRQQTGRTQAPRSDRKKKEKTPDKRRARRRDLPEQDAPEPAAASTSEPESDPEPATQPAAPAPAEAAPGLPVVPELVEAPPIVLEEAPPTTSAEAPPPTSSPKEKKKKKKSGKLEAVPAAETVAKENVVVAVEAVVITTETLAVGSVPSSSAKGEEPRIDTPAKKKKARAEPEPEVAGPLPYKALLSSVTEATLSQKEVHRLMQALQQKTSGEPDVGAALKKKLEEKEKQLNNEKKDAAAAKTRLRDLTQELSAERSKMESLEAGLRAEFLASGHAQATVTQQLQLKVSSLQEQLENGPSGQLTRLTQENSILRDALNQATSQAESRQNAELARLRQEVLRGAREVGELSRRNEVLQSSEERKRSLETKLSSTEQQLAQSQQAHVAKERAHQQREEELQEELRRCGDRLAQAQQHEVTIAELRSSFGSAQEELQVLKAQLEQPEPQSNELEAALEERQRQVVTLETEMDKLKEEMETLRSKVHDSGSETESEQPFESLEKDSQMLALEEELATTRQALEQMKHQNDDLQEENRTTKEALSAGENTFLQRLTDAQQAVVVAEESASHLQTEVQKRLHVLFPEGSVELQQRDWLELLTQKALEIHQDKHTSQELLTELKDKEQVLQTECEKNRNILAQAEQDLVSGRSLAEEQEKVWGHRLALADQQRQEAVDSLATLEESLLLVNSESENKQLREQLMLLEAQLEKQLESSSFTQTYTEEEAQQMEEEKQEQTSLQTPQEQEQEQEQTSLQTPQEQEQEQTSLQTPQEQEQEQEQTSLQTPQEQEQEQEQEQTSSQEAADLSEDGTSV